MLISLPIISLLVCCSASTRKQDINNTPIDALNVTRFLGRWYEIARYDHRFERGIDYAMAEYELKRNGSIRVTNSGTKDEVFRSVTGHAFQPDPLRNPARLRVSFFRPFYSDYRVLWLSPDYNYAIIGSKSPKYLWILSRLPDIPFEILDTMMDEITERGYSMDELIWVKQQELDIQEMMQL